GSTPPETSGSSSSETWGSSIKLKDQNHDVPPPTWEGRREEIGDRADMPRVRRDRASWGLWRGRSGWVSIPRQADKSLLLNGMRVLSARLSASGSDFRA